MTWQAPPAVVADLGVGPLRRRAGGVIEVHLGPGLPVAAPGQFVMLDTGDGILPHPFTIFRSQDDGGFSLLLRPGGRPVEALIGRAGGARVRATGPLGRPFPPPVGSGRVVAAAESGRIAPLYGLVRLLAEEGRTAALVVGGERPEHFAALAAFRALGARVERRHGPGRPAFEHVLDHVQASDTLYLAGPEAALAAADRRLTAAGGVAPAAHLALEVAMACGVGACYGCPLRQRRPKDPRHPYIRACVEGPVVAAGEVVFA